MKQYHETVLCDAGEAQKGFEVWGGVSMSLGIALCI